MGGASLLKDFNIKVLPYQGLGPWKLSCDLALMQPLPYVLLGSIDTNIKIMIAIFYGEFFLG